MINTLRAMMIHFRSEVLRVLVVLGVILLAGCQAAPSAELPIPPAAATMRPTVPGVAQVMPAATALPTVGQTAVPVPSPIAPTRPAATAVPTPTPHPLFPYTLAGLRAREFPGGQIRTRAILEQNDAFTRVYFDYPSDGLTITGVMHVPVGEGPFPVLILLHGYYDRGQYFAGADTWQAAEFFARQGYLALAPDLRSWGESDAGLSLFHIGLTADVLNLISSLPSLPSADATRLGLWGHSMGGGIATKVLAVDGRVQTAVLYAPNSAADADLITRWGPGCLPGQSVAAGDHCNPGEVIPPDTPPEVLAAYQTAVTDPEFLRQVAPLYHLETISAPVQIHIGTADGQELEQTPPEWSAKLAEGLAAAGKPVDYFTYPDQGHFFSGESWTLFLARSLAFFDAHLKPDLLDNRAETDSIAP